MAVSAQKKAAWKTFIAVVKKAVSEPMTSTNEDEIIAALDANFTTLLENDNLSPS